MSTSHPVALPRGLGLPDALRHLVPMPSRSNVRLLLSELRLSDPPGDPEVLGRVVSNLRFLEHRLHHEAILTAPTKREFILYALILKHVSTSCFLFISEHAAPMKPSPAVPEQEGGHAAFKADESLIAHCREVRKEAFSMVGCSYVLSDLIKDWRSSILKNLSGEPIAAAYAPVVDKRGPQEKTRTHPDDLGISPEICEDHGRLLDGKDCEGILADILQELDGSWRRRSYAAPRASEVEQYREIRKLVVSSLGCIAGKLRWLKNFAAPTRKRKPLYCEDFAGGVDGTVSLYDFVVAEDLMREYISLMTECRLHPFDILALGKAANPEPKPLTLDTPLVQVSDMDVDHRDDCACLEDTTRMAHLRKILREMHNINARPFTVDDFRFYILVREHLESVIWHAENHYVSYECHPDPDFVDSKKARDEGSRSGKTHEQSIREIISSLEYIKARWLAIPPTREECAFYVEIRDVFICKWVSSLDTTGSGVVPLREEEMVDAVRRFLDETRKFIKFAHREVQLDKEAMTACKKDTVALPVDVFAGLQDAAERIERAAIMMFKRHVVLERMTSDMGDILGSLWNDLVGQRNAIVSEQAAIYASFLR